MYGLTEAFRSTYLPPDQVDHRPASMGKAIPEVEILVINDRAARCAPGEVGELVHCGANCLDGLLARPGEHRADVPASSPSAARRRPP